MGRYINILLVFLLVFLQYRLWIAPGSLADVHRMQQHIASLSDTNAELEARNAAAQAEVDSLRGEGVDALEARARQYLGLVRADEEFFLVVDQRR